MGKRHKEQILAERAGVINLMQTGEAAENEKLAKFTELAHIFNKSFFTAFQR